MFVVTTTSVVMLLVWGLSQRFNLHSLHNIFILIWAYYTFCVPLDLMFFPELLSPSVGGMPNLGDETFGDEIGITFFHYLILGGSFFLIYHFLPGGSHKNPRWKLLELPLPPLWVVITLNTLVFVASVVLIGSLSRSEAALLGATNVSYKFFTILTTFVQALNIIYVHEINDRRKALLIVLASFLFTLATGGRTTFVIFMLIFLIRYEIPISRVGRIVTGVLAICFAAFWKLIWSSLSQMIFFGGSASALLDLPSVTVSNFEGIGPYEISVSLLRHWGSSPWLLGETYIVTPLQLLFPRFLSWEPVQTLAEYYGQLFSPNFVALGGGIGFSAVGEAWLNFSHFGPFLLGLVFGYIAKYYDSHPRGLSYWIVVIVFCRLFRSDFASIFKSWLLILGISILVVTVCLRLLGELQAKMLTQCKENH